MNFWTAEIRGVTRAFDSAAHARLYAVTKLTIDGVTPEHHQYSNDVHVLVSALELARVQPLSLQFAGNPNGHNIVIA